MSETKSTVIIDGKEIDLSSFEGYSEEDFDPDQIFDCGQCFCWEKNEDGVWERKRPVKDLRRYFDLDRDYSDIKRYLADGDEVMAKAIEAGRGIRILRQDRWETLVSFIISQNNNIPRIKKCINSLIDVFGEFPSPDRLAGATVEDLQPCHLGYRDKYLIEAARQIAEEPSFLKELASSEVSADEAVETLQKLSGVGPKVASCVALFCLGKTDSFPIDVWMKRVMAQLYGIPENDVKAMSRYAKEHFAPYGGIAQQYLFYFITHKGVDKRRK